MTISRATTRNLLLRSLSDENFALLEPHFGQVRLYKRRSLAEANQPVGQLWFPEGGVTSIVMRLAGGGEMEVGITGREGMVPVNALLSIDSAPYEVFVQVEGPDALTLPYATLRELMREHASLRETLQRYAMAFLVQTTNTAVSAGNHPIGQRLARWLLMCHDRLDGDDLHLTHEFIALMIAVRRSGVTVALHALEKTGAIEARRGTVIVLDRALLERLAGEAYGRSEEEYRKLVGPFPVKD